MNVFLNSVLNSIRQNKHDIDPNYTVYVTH